MFVHMYGDRLYYIESAHHVDRLRHLLLDHYTHPHIIPPHDIRSTIVSKLAIHAISRRLLCHHKRSPLKSTRACWNYYHYYGFTVSYTHTWPVKRDWKQGIIAEPIPSCLPPSAVCMALPSDLRISKCESRSEIFYYFNIGPLFLTFSFPCAQFKCLHTSSRLGTELPSDGVRLQKLRNIEHDAHF